MPKKIIAFIVFMILIIPSAVWAQAQTTFSMAEVALWPEYDRPTMLVIYRLSLSPQTKLPAEIQFRIPSEAGAPHAVAARQPDGSLVNIPYTQSSAGEWSTITFQATSPDLQIEYYDPGLVKNGSNRQFTYIWPGDYAADSFKIDVQEPVGSTNMQIKPGTAISRKGTDGLTYHSLDVGSLPAGQTAEIDISYQKADDQLSSDNVPVEPSGPLNDTASGRTTLTSVLPWMLGLLGVILLVGGGVWYWQSGREKATQPAGRPRHKPAAQPEAPEATDGKHIYCHQCGKRAAPGDRFCRTCGAPLRIS